MMLRRRADERVNQPTELVKKLMRDPVTGPTNALSDKLRTPQRARRGAGP